MTPEAPLDNWADDAQVLYQVARAFLPQVPEVEVRLPRALADQATAAWQRDDVGFDLDEESPLQRSIRHAAANLALIGLAIESTGVDDGNDVKFSIGAWLLGSTLDVADQADSPQS